MSVGTERGWVGRIAVPQTGCPCGTTLVSDVSVGTLVSDVSVGTLVSIVSILKKTYLCKVPTTPTNHAATPTPQGFPCKKTKHTRDPRGLTLPLFSLILIPYSFMKTSWQNY